MLFLLGIGTAVLVLVLVFVLWLQSSTVYNGIDVETRCSVSPDGRLLFDAVAGTRRLRIAGRALPVSLRAGTRDIYAADLGTGQITRLTTTGENSDPTYSPDGHRVAFISHRDGNAEVYLMDADGSHERRLTHSPNEEYPPTFSPDGDLLAFTRRVRRTRVVNDLILLNIQAAQERHVVTVEDNPYYSLPRFDGPTTIRFKFDSEFHTVDLTGASPKLSSQYRPNFDLRLGQGMFSPDRRTVAYADYVGNGPFGVMYEIFVSDLQLQHPIQLTHNRLANHPCAFSPDGSSLIFKAGRPDERGGLTLWQVNVDGSSLRQINLSMLERL